MKSVISSVSNKLALIISLVLLYVALIRVDVSTFSGLLIGVIIPTIVLIIIIGIMRKPIKKALDSEKITEKELRDKLVKNPILWVSFRFYTVYTHFSAF